MKILSSLATLALLLVTSSTTIRAQEAAAPQPIQEVKSERVPLKFVPARIMAWWLDPQHNERPVEYGGPQAQRGSGRGGNGGTVQLPTGVETVSVAASDNALLIRGNQQGLAEIKATITFLDKPLPFVEFEMLTVSMKGEDADTFFSDDKSPYYRGMRFGKGNVQGLLRTLQREHKAEVVKLASGAAYNEGVAQLANYSETKIVLSNTTVANNATGVLYKTQAPDPTYTICTTETLNVVPTVQYDGTVGLQMWWGITVTERYPHYVTKGVLQTTSKLIETSVNVRDGQTFAVARRFINMRPTTESAPDPKRREEKVLVYLVTAHVAPVPK